MNRRLYQQNHVQELLVNELKQQLANSEGARSLAEGQLLELRRTQKAVGQPTEVSSTNSFLSSMCSYPFVVQDFT